MKIFRIIIGLAAIVFALWVIVGEQMSGASADAVVNAPVVTIRAGTAGDLTLPDREFGARVEAGETIAQVIDPRVDRIRLDDLAMELDFARAETTRTEADLAATRALREALLDRTETFRSARIEELETRLDHARSRLDLLENGAGTDATRQRLRDAVDDTPDRLPAEPILDALALDHARERVAVLEIALRAAQDGVFLGDGYNDSPNAEQRATELESQIAQLENSLTEAQARQTAYANRLSRAQVQVNQQGGGDITAPVNGRYWEVLQADGVNVQRGDPILRLLDCDHVIVTLSVTERIYNTLTVGDTAEFRLAGSAQVFDATVARLAGSGAATIYEHLAVAPSQRHLERYDVTLLVPGLATDPDLACAIGRTGRAFFDRRPLDWLRG